MNKNLVFYFIPLMLVFVSCHKYSAEKDLDSIVLYMGKEDVMDKMSSRGVARGSIVNKYGQAIEVREYQIERDKSGKRIGVEAAYTALTLGLGSWVFLTPGEIDTYWLYFCNGKLVQWGRAGDWAEAERKVYDIKFKVS